MPYQGPEFDTRPLEPEVVQRRHAARQYTRGLLPEDTKHLTMGVDLGKRVGHWLLGAWRPGCRPLVSEYSTFEVPSQGMAVENAILIALETLRDNVILKGFHTADGRLLIPNPVFVDCNYQGEEADDEAVFAFCREKESGSRFRPVVGRGLSQHDRRFRTYAHPTKLGATVKFLGLDYYVSWVPQARLFRVEVNVDFWKCWVFDRLRTPPGKDGAMEFYASTNPNEHVTLAKHLTAERPEETFVEGRGTVIVWKKLRKGNHFLDALTYMCAAGHLAGARLITPPVTPCAVTAAEIAAVQTGLTMPDGRPFAITDR